MIITNELIQRTLIPYRYSPPAEQCDAIRAYIKLLQRWNEKISLTTVVDPEEILRFHFGESLLAAAYIPVRNGRLADVGSGAGFPGIPLRLAAPALSVTLIESNTKKAAFLAEVIRELKLSGVEVIRERMRDAPGDLQNLDFISARALGMHESLENWARQRLSSTGKLILWLGESDLRTVAANDLWIWSEPIHIPGSKRRFIISGSMAT